MKHDETDAEDDPPRPLFVVLLLGCLPDVIRNAAIADQSSICVEQINHLVPNKYSYSSCEKVNVLDNISDGEHLQAYVGLLGNPLSPIFLLQSIC